MRTSPLRGVVRKGNSQGLNPQALKDKRARDVKAASLQYRIDRRSENQSIGQNGNTDLHHKPDGSVVRMKPENNRNVWKHEERT